jgi:hypothetical protein
MKNNDDIPTTDTNEIRQLISEASASRLAETSPITGLQLLKALIGAESVRLQIVAQQKSWAMNPAFHFRAIRSADLEGRCVGQDATGIVQLRRIYRGILTRVSLDQVSPLDAAVSQVHPSRQV